MSMAKTAYLLPNAAISDPQSNVDTGAYTDIDEGVTAGPNDSDFVKTINDEWNNGTGITSAFSVPLDNAPNDYALGTTGRVRARCRISAQDDDTTTMTGDASGISSPFGTITWSDSDTNDAWNTRATTAVSISGATPSNITNWNLRFYQTAWSRSMGSDGSHYDISCCEVEINYNTVWEEAEQFDWRWYDDDNADPDSMTALAAIDTSYEVPIADLGNAHVLRFHVKHTQYVGGGVNAQLQYNKDAGGWNDVTTTSSNIRVIAGTPTDGAACDTELLTNEGGTFVGGGTFDDVDGEARLTTGNSSTGTETELAFCFEFRTADLSGGEDIDFRLIEPGGGDDVVIALGSGATAPNATIEAASGDVVETPTPSTSWDWTGQALKANEDITVAASTSWAWSGQALKANQTETIAPSTSWAWSGQAFKATQVEEIVASSSWAWTGLPVTETAPVVEEVAASTTWAWTGQELDVNESLPILATASWSWSGQNLYTDLVTLVEVGSFNWAGQELGADEALFVAPSTGWAWSGQEVQADQVETLTPSTSWAWTGQSFNVNAAFVESIPESSSWAWTGQALDDVQDINEIIDESSSWAWTGLSVIDFVGIQETIDVSSSWAWSGQNVYISPDVLLSVGSFSFTGQEVYANQFHLVDASVSWSWSGQAFKANVDIPVSVASFTWSGQAFNVNAAVNETITPSNSWGWSGQAITDSTDIIHEVATSASWGWTGQDVTDIIDYIEIPAPALFNWQGQQLTETSGPVDYISGNIVRDVFDSIRIKQQFGILDIDRDYPSNKIP
jgi:hypothetical protein